MKQYEIRDGFFVVSSVVTNPDDPDDVFEIVARFPLLIPREADSDPADSGKT